VDPDLGALYDRYFGILRQKCLRMLPDTGEAEDVAQETFIRLWSARARFTRPEQVVAWLYRTSTRLAVDRLRRRRVRAAASEAQPVAEVAVTGSPELEVHYRAAWARLSRRLSADELELALLAHVDRMSQPEIAQVLDSSERTIRRRLAKLSARLQRLREELEP
jgi:RNA polymerase sigma-70 factor (ECF subfamily)